VMIGSGIGGIETLEEQNKILIERGPSRVSPFTVPRLMVNAASGNVSIMFGIQGPNSAVATACATGSNAIGDAGRYIQYDMADVMIAGGSEAALCELGMASFCAARALSVSNEIPHKASRPFDKGRDGFVMSEGAGVVVLEEYEHAKKRGARIYAELIGYGMSGDATHITAPEPEGRGATLAMRRALADAGVAPGEIAYVNAHATSTPAGDRSEALALRQVFTAAGAHPRVSSTKGLTGHPLSMAGVMEAAFCSVAVRDGFTPGNANLTEPDEACAGLDLPRVTTDAAPDLVLNNSSGFGGSNVCHVLRRVAS